MPLRRNPFNRDFSPDWHDVLMHMVIEGGSRMGKTNHILGYIYYLMKPSTQKEFPCSVIFIDPHGYAGLQAAAMMGDWGRLFFFNPYHTPFSFNPLELPPAGRNRPDLVQKQVAQLVELLSDVMKTDQATAPRMYWIYRVALFYLYSFGDQPTFLDLYYLMNEMMKRAEETAALFRRADIAEELVARSMESVAELEKAAFTTVMNRVSNFVIPADSYASRTFCARNSSVPFEELLVPGTLGIFSLPEKDIPSDFRDIFMSTLVMKIYFLVQERAKNFEEAGKDPSSIPPVVIFIDEFQSIEKLELLDKIISEAAKFGVRLVLANQFLSQLSRKSLVDAILSNAKTFFFFATGPDDARVFSKLLGKEYAADGSKSLTKLSPHEAVMRRYPPGGTGLPEIRQISISKAPDPVHTQEEVVAFIRERMAAYAGGGEDREPIYESELEQVLAEKGAPLVNFVNWRVLTHIYYGTQPSPENVMFLSFYSKYWIAKSEVQNALDELTDLKYLARRGTLGRIPVTNSSGDVEWRQPSPSVKDEMERARTNEYELTDSGREKFFTKPRVKSQRAGTTLHLRVIDHYVEGEQKDGFWCQVDYGDKHAARPDVMVFHPAQRTKENKETGEKRTGPDPYRWDEKNIGAIEVETNPRKNYKQVRKNYEKCLKNRYSYILFAVTTPEHGDDIRRILHDKDPTSYSLETVDVGMSLEDLRKQLVAEEEPVGEEAWVSGKWKEGEWRPPEEWAGTTKAPVEKQEECQPSEQSNSVKGPLGDLPPEAYDRLVKEIYPFARDNGVPLVDEAYVRKLALDPGWKDDPVWKAVAEKKAERGTAAQPGPATTGNEQTTRSAGTAGQGDGEGTQQQAIRSAPGPEGATPSAEGARPGQAAEAAEGVGKNQPDTKGLAILCRVGAMKVVTRADIAVAVGLSASHTSRLLRELVEEGYLVRDSRKYTLTEHGKKMVETSVAPTKRSPG